MQPSPDEEPTGGPTEAATLKPSVGPRGAEYSLRAALDPSEGTVASRDLDRVASDLRRRERLAEDAELVTWLARHRFSGPDYERFAEELVKYGYAVMVAWIRKGLIFARCREKGFGGLPEPPFGALAHQDVAEELAGETVAKALHHFRDDVLRRRKWDPKRGASIKTFFIGQCLMQFGNVYRAWLGHEADRGETLVDDHALLDQVLVGPRSDPAELAVIRQEIETRFAEITNPRLREALVLIAAGWSQREIAAQVGMSEKAVERMLAHYRQGIAKRRTA